jgi:hypothetical protein
MVCKIQTLEKHGVDDLTNVAKVTKAIEYRMGSMEKATHGSRKAYLNALVFEMTRRAEDAQNTDEVKKLMRIKDTYSSLMREAETLRRKEIADQELEEEKDDGDKVEWDDLKNLYKKPDLTGQERAALALFTLFPPRRTQDYPLMETVSKTPNKSVADKNWLVFSSNGTAKFVFRQYKTRSSHGSHEFPVPPELLKILHDSGVVNKGMALFKTENGHAYTSNTFGNWFGNLTKRLLGNKRATVNTFRHAFITDFMRKNPPTSAKEKIADAMAHTVGTQAKYDQRKGWGCGAGDHAATRSSALDSVLRI